MKNVTTNKFMMKLKISPNTLISVPWKYMNKYVKKVDIDANITWDPILKNLNY